MSETESELRYNQVMAELYSILTRLGFDPSGNSIKLLLGGKSWTYWLREYLEMPIMTDSLAMCAVLQQIFNAMRLPLTPRATDRIFNADLVLKGDEPPVIKRGPLRINLARKP